MNKINKRLKKLESIINPQWPARMVRVIQGIRETEGQAFERAGLSQDDLGDTFVIIRKIIEPKTSIEATKIPRCGKKTITGWIDTF